jgi:hypothetical protein
MMDAGSAIFIFVVLVLFVALITSVVLEYFLEDTDYDTY